MSDALYPKPTRELTARRAELAPATHDAFQAFSKHVFADGALPEKTKQLIAIAVAHTTQSPPASAATRGSRSTDSRSRRGEHASLVACSRAPCRCAAAQRPRRRPVRDP